MIGKITAGTFIVAATLAGGLSSASALTLYCSADEVWCQQMARDFESETGITVDMTRKSSGETYAQVRAEAANPKGDIWWAGTGDPHLQAAQEGLTEPYVSPMRSELHDWALKQAKTANDRTIASIPARWASATIRTCSRRTTCPSRNAGPTLSSPNTRARSRSRTRTPPARPTQCWPRLCS